MVLYNTKILLCLSLFRTFHGSPAMTLRWSLTPHADIQRDHASTSSASLCPLSPHFSAFQMQCPPSFESLFLSSVAGDIFLLWVTVGSWAAPFTLTPPRDPYSMADSFLFLYQWLPKGRAWLSFLCTVGNPLDRHPKKRFLGWRKDSEVKSTYCSCRSPEFGCQHPHGLTNCLNSHSRESEVLYWPLGLFSTHTHMQAKHPYTHK